MKRLNRLLIIAAVAALCLLLTACSAGRSNYGYDNAPSAPGESATEERYDSGFTKGGPLEAPESVDNEALPQASTPPMDDSARKLVYRASYSIKTYAFDADYAKIVAATHEAGGHIENEYTHGSKPEAYGDSGRYSEMTLRIPVNRYDDFRDMLSGIGSVTSKNQTSEDITRNYYDNEARIEMYEIRYDKLKDYLKKAENMEDIIALESEMSDILYTLDDLKGEKRHYDELVALTTITVNLTEAVDPGEVSVSNEDFGSRAGEAFNASIKGIGVFFEEFAIFFVAAAPVLVIIALGVGILLAIILGSRALVIKRKKAREKAKAQSNE